MSGGHFNHAYLLLEVPDDVVQRFIDPLRVMAQLMKDVEWVESGDSVFDERMSRGWYREVHNLCVRLSGEGDELEQQGRQT